MQPKKNESVTSFKNFVDEFDVFVLILNMRIVEWIVLLIHSNETSLDSSTHSKVNLTMLRSTIVQRLAKQHEQLPAW